MLLSSEDFNTQDYVFTGQKHQYQRVLENSLLCSFVLLASGRRRKVRIRRLVVWIRQISHGHPHTSSLVELKWPTTERFNVRCREAARRSLKSRHLRCQFFLTASKFNSSFHASWKHRLDQITNPLTRSFKGRNAPKETATRACILAFLCEL